MNKVGSAVADANRLKFNPIDKATLADIDRVRAQVESLKKISGDLRKRLKDTGQESTDFFEIDWSKIYADPNSRSRQMRKAYEYVTQGTGASFSAMPEPAPTGRIGRDDSESKREWDRIQRERDAANDDSGGGASSWKRKVVSSGLRAAGPVGGVADDAIGAGLSGGAMAGLAGLAGGLVALGVGKLMGSIKEKIGAAEQDDVGYDTLKRQLGDVGVGFEVLKQSIHAVANGLGLTFQEGQKLGTEFARLAGLTADNYRGLAGEVSNSAGFARSFGLDPSQSNAFFAQMRQFQATQNATDSTKLALVIGDAIAKSGAFSKSDEMLQAISSYTSQQTRLGLATANVDGYAGMLTSLVASKTPGLDPIGSAGMLSRVNSSIANGGAAGEAGQHFMYMTVGKSLGLDPIQTRMLLQQGAFGTAAGTFGRGTLAGNWMRSNGASLSSAATGSRATNLEMILGAINRIYSGSPERRELGLNAGANLLGINESAFAALSQMKPTDVGSLSRRLQRMGVDLGKLDASNISTMAQIDADGSLSDDEKNKRIRDAAPKSQMETIGSDIRKDTNLMSNKLQELADKGVPLLNDMRAGILYLAGAKDGTGPMAIAQAVAKAQNVENVGAINSSAQSRIDPLRKAAKELNTHKFDLQRAINDPRSSAEEVENAKKTLATLEKNNADASSKIAAIEQERNELLQKEKDRYEKELNDLKGRVATVGSGDTNTSAGAGGGAPSADKTAFSQKYDAFADEVAKGTGVSKRLILAQLALETGWGKKEIAGANNPFNVQAFGWNGDTVTSMDKHADGSEYVARFRKYGSMHEAAEAQIAMMKRKYKGVLNAGDDASKFTSGLSGYAESPTYARDLASIANGLGKQMSPDELAAEGKAKKQAAESKDKKIAVEVTHRHETQAGAPISTIKSVNTSVSKPIPLGMSA
ncbi:glucosaminidase domain-containing protein [Caballeronia pedi]|nr:glucosaminidase domain-containing protein [Caballeronia pedi]